MLVVCILVLFSLYVKSLKKNGPVVEGGNSLRGHREMLIACGGFAIFYWLLDSARDLLVNPEANIIKTLLLPTPIEFWIRMLAIFVLLLFALYGQSLINQRKKAEAKLREGEERLQQILQQMPYPIEVFDTDGYATMVNQAYLNAFKLNSEEEIIGRHNLLTDAQLRKIGLQDKIKAVYQGKTVLIPEIAFPLQNESVTSFPISEMLIFEITLFPVFRSDREIWRVVMIWKNITNQKKAENEREVMHEQLLQAKKMEAVGLLAGGIAHDFNNILTAIQGSAEIALLDCDEKNGIYDDIKQIQRSANRAADLTKQLLLFSRKHPMKFKAFNLNRIIQDLFTMLRRLIGEDIIIKTELTQDLHAFRADRSTIEQVIMNLAVNARGAMPDGGLITFKTENIVYESHVEENGNRYAPGNYIRLTIKDTGSGIDAETLNHIFEPFFSTKGPGSGTGLGLSVVFGIVQQHKGWIKVNSKPHYGTEFKITFPATDERVQDPAIMRKQFHAHRGNGERLLVVEDDENVREFTVRALHTNGYEVISAASAEEALQLFEKEKRNFQLVLSDVVLPGKNGLELVDELLSRKPGLHILLGSGYMDQKSQWPVIKDKGFRFLQKPYILDELICAVGDAVNA
jgi:signal transduction histidine kinase/CheY-like chemotaxis protein